MSADPDAVPYVESSVRGQLATLQHEDLIEQRGTRRGTSKPARLYSVTPQAELLFSRAYVPILRQLLHALARRLTPAEFDSVMREVGRDVMGDRAVPREPLRDRVSSASSLLEDLGGLTEVEKRMDSTSS